MFENTVPSINQHFSDEADTNIKNYNASVVIVQWATPPAELNMTTITLRGNIILILVDFESESLFGFPT